MVKRGPKPKVAGKNSEPENIGGYFRKVFKEKPKWLVTRSNEEVLGRWLSDHPGEREVPDRIKQNLANVKSVLRKKLRKRGRPKGSVNAVSTTPAGLQEADVRRHSCGAAPSCASSPSPSAWRQTPPTRRWGRRRRGSGC